MLLVIETERHRLIWQRAVLLLSAIGDHIQFSVSRQKVLITAVNAAKVTHAEVVFSSQFFQQYQINFDDVTAEGFDGTTYSFLVNSKHLAVLFRNMDADVQYICLRINWVKSAPMTTQFKLMIEIRTKSEIVKKYQTSYAPIAAVSPTVVEEYKRAGDEVRHLVVDQMIPKNFLDMVPLTTEDFKIETKNGKITLTAYTRQVLRDKEYLKQPMLVSISLGLDELTELNVDQSVHNTLNFRLRDFKNFMNLVGLFNPANDDEYVNLGGLDTSFHVYFVEPGDPIVFAHTLNPVAEVHFILTTANDLGNHETRYVIPTPVPVPTSATSTRKRTPSDITPTPEVEEYVRYDKRARTQPSLPPTDYTAGIGSDSTDYSDQEIDTAYLGPTQVEKPRSIFD